MNISWMSFFLTVELVRNNPCKILLSKVVPIRGEMRVINSKLEDFMSCRCLSLRPEHFIRSHRYGRCIIDLFLLQ